MNYKKNSKKIGLILLSLIISLLLVQIVIAGITNPLPPEIQLKQSESGRFKFQIQNMNNPNNLSCSFELNGKSPITVEFDESEAVLVEAKKIKEFYGTASIGTGVENGLYTQEFCVLCNPAQAISGSSVRTEVCGMPVNVKVVNEKTKENMAIPTKPTNWTLVISLVLGVLITLWLIGYLLHEYTTLFRPKNKKGKGKGKGKKNKKKINTKFKNKKSNVKNKFKNKKIKNKTKSKNKKTWLSNLFNVNKNSKKKSKIIKNKKSGGKIKSKKRNVKNKFKKIKKRNKLARNKKKKVRHNTNKLSKKKSRTNKRKR